MKKLKQAWNENNVEFHERQWEESVRHRYQLLDKLLSMNITNTERERIKSLIFGDEQSCNLAEIIINHKYDTSRNNR